MKIKSIKPAGIEPVYNMTVDEHHDYLVAGGLVLRNCDALRYFCITRTLGAERVIVPEEDVESETTYDEEMTGGEMTADYLNYGG